MTHPFPEGEPAQPSLSTTLVHHPYQPPAGFESPSVGVHKASTVFFPNVAAMRSRQWVDRSAYTYGLHGTPTTFVLEQRLATLEGARHVTLAPSGLAAVTMVAMSFLKSGDHQLLPDNVYAPNLHFARHELAGWGVEHDVYDAMSTDSLRAKLRPSTKLVWLEAAGSITLEFPDLQGLIRTVREHAPQALIVIDNTWGAGIAFNAFELGVDLSVHALTKYPSGGGDVLMGSVACVRDDLHRALSMCHGSVGFNVGMNDVEHVLRGLPSIDLRYHRHDASAREVARWLQSQPGVKQVLHPALEGSPGHEHWRATCRGAAGLLAIVFDDAIKAAQIDAFVDALRLFRIGYSWGGPTSLAVPYDLAKTRAALRHRAEVLRLNIGLEAPTDLIADLRRAWPRLSGGAA